MQRTDYKSIVVLTGAGISAESGIRTFRASDGLWENHPVEDVATPEGFARNPALVQSFYNERRRQLVDVEPNAAHKALANFEQRFQGDFLLVTQNVDDLHQRSGSQHVIPMHGELNKVRCIETHSVFQWTEDLGTDTLCPCCQRPGNLRPHIVWFGEMPLDMDVIDNALSHCDLFVSVGTSGNVYPAAGFCQEARSRGAHTVELNLEPSQTFNAFVEARHGPATTVVPDYFSGLLKR